MSIFEAFILGIIQGLTEFLPVSSSGHIEIGKALLAVQMQEPLLFSVLVHCATSLSTVVIFRKDILQILQDILKFEWNESTQFAAKIVLSMIPVGFVGLLFEEQIEAFFEGNIVLVGAMLILTGFLLLITYFVENQEGTEVTFRKALIIGIAQAIAIVPGISRAGATIATALILGVKRSEASRFSFLMVIAPILGATLLKFKKYLEMGSSGDLGFEPLLVGFMTSFVVGLLACRLMLRIVGHGKIYWFSAYCLLVGTLTVVWKMWF